MCCESLQRLKHVTFLRGLKTKLVMFTETKKTYLTSFNKYLFQLL